MIGLESVTERKEAIDLKGGSRLGSGKQGQMFDAARLPLLENDEQEQVGDNAMINSIIFKAMHSTLADIPQRSKKALEILRKNRFIC